jgi:hypothetical protein
LNRLQISANTGDGGGARVASVPQIKDESRISDRIAAESGWSDVTSAKELFYLFQQMH